MSKFLYRSENREFIFADQSDEQVLEALRKRFGKMKDEVSEILLERFRRVGGGCEVKWLDAQRCQVTVVTNMTKPQARKTLTDVGRLQLLETYYNYELNDALLNIDAFWKQEWYPDSLFPVEEEPDALYDESFSDPYDD